MQLQPCLRSMVVLLGLLIGTLLHLACRVLQVQFRLRVPIRA